MGALCPEPGCHCEGNTFGLSLAEVLAGINGEWQHSAGKDPRDLGEGAVQIQTPLGRGLKCMEHLPCPGKGKRKQQPAREHSKAKPGGAPRATSTGHGADRQMGCGMSPGSAQALQRLCPSGPCCPGAGCLPEGPLDPSLKPKCVSLVKEAVFMDVGGPGDPWGLVCRTQTCLSPRKSHF